MGGYVGGMWGVCGGYVGGMWGGLWRYLVGLRVEGFRDFEFRV